MSAAALGTGAVVVVAVGLGVSIARTDDGGVRTAADAAPAGSSPSATASVSPTGSPSARPVRDDQRHSDVPGVGRSGGTHRGGTAGGGHQQPTPTDLPFTGSGPLPATTALGLLLAAAGSWTLVRVPGVRSAVPMGITADALDRLRAPRRLSR